ncbi:broad specificity phosphatase PhoE [Kitasatospora sp. SolWspMP-SS2h]|uniref:histidine phosphatase family protein n=1 Tax=Kitasatospora sp. SolWspMP-SS2h TaxID=1305729 RepID=UPI000DBA3526|nr:histidine phosphatase family protein [Kitasatospora sp. SolWspMP-SS2h]RAJ47219.1 broad specificity phosphatase PhoE [Kitasatospora sp. SolWspMP-SS2h]
MTTGVRTVRVALIAPALGAELHGARFGDDRPLTEAELAPARVLAAPRADRVLSAPSPRCRQTAGALGLVPDAVEPALADLDAGAWRGRPLAELAAAEPRALAAWLSDPDFAPPGGESVTALLARVGRWLDALPADTGRLLAVAEPAVVRAAVVHALALPPAAFWRLDVAPLTATHLSGRAARWNLRCGTALSAAN